MDLLVPLLHAFEHLDKKLMECTSGKHKNQYPTDVILELQDILNRIEKLLEKLEEKDYPGSYRFGQ